MATVDRASMHDESTREHLQIPIADVEDANLAIGAPPTKANDSTSELSERGFIVFPQVLTVIPDWAQVFAPDSVIKSPRKDHALRFRRLDLRITACHILQELERRNDEAAARTLTVVLHSLKHGEYLSG